RTEAIETFKASVGGILDGSIKFADLAGGVSQGLLLWYSGVTAQDLSAVASAENYLRKLTGHASSQFWPGPLARFVLRQLTFEQLLFDNFATLDPEVATINSKADLLSRRRLVQTFFYYAVSERAHNDESTCRAWMLKCAQLENPILEVEWYLARAESQQQPA